MGREAIKDVRQTVHESYFGQPEHAPELGTPMNPTSQEVTSDRGNLHGTFAERVQESAGNSRDNQQEIER